MDVSWNAMSCSLLDINQCFGGTCCLIFTVTAMRTSNLKCGRHFGKYAPSTAGLTDYRKIIISMLDSVTPCMASVPVSRASLVILWRFVTVADWWYECNIGHCPLSELHLIYIKNVWESGFISIIRWDKGERILLINFEGIKKLKDCNLINMGLQVKSKFEIILSYPWTTILQDI